MATTGNTLNNSNVDTSTNEKSLIDNRINDLIQENKKLNEYIEEQEEALFSEIQKNAKLEKANTELYEQINYFKMEIVDLNQKISYITNKINCDDIVKDLIYKQQAEIISLKEELSMSKNTSTQLRSRLKSQVEELKFIKRQSLQITSDMAKEVESQLANIQHQLYEANKTIEDQQAYIDLVKENEKENDDIKVKFVNLKKQYEEVINNKPDDENLKTGVKALISIINDLETKNDDFIVLINEVGEEIKNLKDKIKVERKDNNLMANEMGQEIINLTQQVNDYKSKINKLNELVINKSLVNDISSFKSETYSQLCNCIKDVQLNLSNIKVNSDINKNNAIDKIEIKLDKIANALKQQEVVALDNSNNNNTNCREVIISGESFDEELYESFKEKIDYMKKVYNDSLNTINEMGNELIESKANDKNNEKKISALSEIILKLMETIVNLENDKKSLQSNIDEYLIVINDCGEDIRKLHFNEKDLITAISESGHEICVLKQKIQEMISYQEKYMSMDGEVLMNKVATLTSRNQDLEKELTLLRKFDINNSLKKSLEEGQLQSAWYEISKLRSHVDKLTQNSKQLEKELANARSEISSIILTRDEALITQQEVVENFESLQRFYVQQMHQLRNEIFRVYSSSPSEANNRILNLVNEMQMLPNYSNIQYENHARNAKYEVLEGKIHEAEEIIDTLTRENFEYQMKLNKLNEINEKLIAKLLVQNKNSQDSLINLSQSSNENSNQFVVPKRSEDRRPSSSVHNNAKHAYISPSSTPIPPPHGTTIPISSSNDLITSLPTPPRPLNTSIPTPSNSKNVITDEKSTSPFIPPPINTLKKLNPHIIKVKHSIENLNKRGLKRAASQLCLQSNIRSPDEPTPPLTIPKFISSVPIKTDSFSIHESEDEYKKLLNYFGSIPHNNRISNIREEYLDMRDYMTFEIKNQHQIMEAVKNGEIPFYSSDNEDSTEIFVINEDE
ncbi:hypothetical protein BCR36DRAFT_140648 [Piromyces finnis]|uniref:Uncharacterized protein n=1 Tax=Piromyces finnis TaxID=1754191 RepID=A0A1Y1UYZ3_9FUNG|nr:hypothetical protein BCR36DRAFT_140648 [Piromyces finnis]|eukprot:ORX43793.1 hypothetical protein BCR36DRAFT_140648 [Piromyces finnis]